MKVLVTGATGFIGSWLTRKLLEEGHMVRVLCRPQSDLSEIKPHSFEKSLGDVTDPPSCEAACKGIDTVFHLAGYVGYAAKHRPLMESVNVNGTKNILNSCDKMSVRRLVHMSSVVTIGASFDGKAPLNENSPYNLEYLNLGYFETKRRAESLVLNAVKDRLIDAVILNPSTVYGGGDAKKDSRKTQIKVAQGKLPFYTTGGVSVTAIEDVVDATIKAWNIGRTGERYILAGENLLIRDLFRLIAEESGVRPPRYKLPKGLVLALGKAGDLLERWGKKGPLSYENAWTAVLYHWFDSSKAKAELGYNPRSARLAIHSSVEWMKNKGLLRK